MPHLYSCEEIGEVLAAAGFVMVRQKGSHQIWRRGEQPREIGRTVPLPANRREIPYGTFKAILKQAGLTEDEFKALLA
jgi:predicted RNA binding protein YcfA (HicA-like mRNA interferase family)